MYTSNSNESKFIFLKRVIALYSNVTSIALNFLITSIALIFRMLFYIKFLKYSVL